GYILPGEYARSILATEIEKEKPAQQLEKVFQTIPNAEPNPNDSEKLKLEKSILKLQREIQKDLEKFPREAEQEKQKEEWLKILEKKSHEQYNVIDFGSTESSSPEFLQKKVAEICKQEKNYEEKLEGYSPTIWLKNIDKITNPELENELVKIIDPKQNTNLGKQQVERSFYFLEKKIRINKVEEIIDLSQFTLVATTSVSNPKLSNKIKA
ncbi:26550_t:CDS:2, partial [Racocetra persica]